MSTVSGSCDGEGHRDCWENKGPSRCLQEAKRPQRATVDLGDNTIIRMQNTRRPVQEGLFKKSAAVSTLLTATRPFADRDLCTVAGCRGESKVTGQSGDRWRWFGALTVRRDEHIQRVTIPPNPPRHDLPAGQPRDRGSGVFQDLSRQSVLGSARSRDVSGVGAFEFREVFGAGFEWPGFRGLPWHDHALTA